MFEMLVASDPMLTMASLSEGSSVSVIEEPRRFSWLEY